MNLKERLTEATIRALQGKLTEASSKLTFKECILYLKDAGFNVVDEAEHSSYIIAIYNKDYIIRVRNVYGRYDFEYKNYEYQYDKDFANITNLNDVNSNPITLYIERILNGNINREINSLICNEFFTQILEKYEKRDNINYTEYGSYLRDCFYEKYKDRILSAFRYDKYGYSFGVHKEYDTDKKNMELNFKLTKGNIVSVLTAVKDGINKLNEYLKEFEEVELPKILESIKSQLDKTNNKKKSNCNIKYNITYYENTATRERRPEYTDDVENDWTEESINFNSDLNAFKYICEDILNWDFEDYVGDTDDKTIKNLIKEFGSQDYGFGEPIIISVKGKNYEYDSGFKKEDFLEETEDYGEENIN